MAYSSEEEEDPNRFEDAEDDMAIAVPSAPSTSDAVHVQAVPVAVRPQPAGARGKPEAAAAALAAAKRDTLKQELESTATVKKEDGYDDDDEDEDDAVAVVAEPVESAAAADAKAVAPETPKAKPPPKKKARKTPAKKSPASTKSKSKAKSSPAIDLLMGPTIDNPVEPMTDVDYENLIALMEHFCKVPLLAEFSRPVSLLHPELVSVYNKIVSHPVDLGKVCRKIRKREYKNTREVQLDMWRIFSNCVKYHMHPSNKEAVRKYLFFRNYE